ncbi:hypothetical protein CK203_026045 [Vitis vinifera]|uniref:Uncharacterized protein n=1 Tax=Vitis vinifera TaxID=29760 RepID=A0A438IJG1_VITVI|nr:hypothetical protein CK203_026045 [Vitis vinifera]
MPSSIRQILEHIQRDFLWKGGNLEQKPHLVRWELVCLSKKKGGLGIKSLSTLNKALLCNGIEVREAYHVGLWKGIRMDWDIMGTRISFSVGGGGEKLLEAATWKKVCGDVEDVVFWTKTKSGKFSVKSLYNALESGSPSLFPSDCIWNM